jgi:succinyl-CoA synthetase beta subunit
VGLGGIEVELFKDKAVAIPPLSIEDSSKLLLKLKSSKVLTGFRGSAPLDFDALVRTISAFSDMAVLLREHVSEMEINPVAVLSHGYGVVALDALVRINSN